MPAASLTRELSHRLRRLGPADRVGDEHDAVALPPLPQVPVEPYDQLDVLADGVARVPADRLDQRAPEEPERAGDDQQRVHPAPADPADQEGAEVLEHLQGRESAPGQADVVHAAVVDPTAVGDADDPAGRDDDVRLRHDRPHDPQEGVLLEDRVGVDREHVRVARRVHRGVQRVRLAAVLLVDDPQVAVAPRDVHAPDRRGRQQDAERLAHRHEVEGLAEPFQRRVARAVVDDDHLVERVAQREQRANALDDRRLLVVGRHEHRDGRRDRARRRPRRPERARGRAGVGSGRATRSR